MLALARSHAGLRSARHARTLCAADPVKILSNLEDAIARAKVVVASEAMVAYEPSEFSADASAGKINVLKLGEVFKDDPDAKKDMMKKASMINDLTKKVAAGATGEIDFADMDAKFASVGLPGVVVGIKPQYEAHLSTLKKMCDDGLAKDIADVDAQLKSIFQGSNGLIAHGEARDKAIAAAKVAMLEDLENLASETKNLDDLTVAELLEKNPAWKEAIEEDLKNHNWGSEIPASLKAAKVEATAAEDVKAIS